jgi:hypothetical protein
MSHPLKPNRSLLTARGRPVRFPPATFWNAPNWFLLPRHGEKNLALLKQFLMETTIRINTDLLNADVIDGIKKMFPHKTVDIIVQPADTTEYILSNPAYANELQERIEAYNRKKEAIFLKPEDLL